MYEKELNILNRHLRTIRITPEEISILGHFMLDDREKSISRKLKNKFSGTLNSLNLGPKNVKVVTLIKRKSKPQEVKSKMQSHNKSNKMKVNEPKIQKKNLKNGKKIKKKQYIVFDSVQSTPSV